MHSPTIVRSCFKLDVQSRLQHILKVHANIRQRLRVEEKLGKMSSPGRVSYETRESQNVFDTSSAISERVVATKIGTLLFDIANSLHVAHNSCKSNAIVRAMFGPPTGFPPGPEFCPQRMFDTVIRSSSTSVHSCLGTTTKSSRSHPSSRLSFTTNAHPIDK